MENRAPDAGSLARVSGATPGAGGERMGWGALTPPSSFPRRIFTLTQTSLFRDASELRETVVHFFVVLSHVVSEYLAVAASGN